MRRGRGEETVREYESGGEKEKRREENRREEKRGRE